MKSLLSGRRRLRWKLKLATFLYVLLLFSLAWLSNTYTAQIDVTLDSRNTLSDTSLQLLNAMNGPIDISVYMDQNKVNREKIKRLIGRYQSAKPDIKLTFINPITDPRYGKQLQAELNNTINVSFQGRSENINVLNEAELSNTLYHLSHSKDQWVTFIKGHGERSPTGDKNHDWKLFGKELKKRFIHIVSINLMEVPAIPENSNSVVIASPMAEFLDGEMEIILDYIDRGGNLFWICDPDSANLIALSIQLGINKLPGTLIDPKSRQYGVDNPTFVISKDYPDHAITKNFNVMSVFPITAALKPDTRDFLVSPFLSNGMESWTETGPLAGAISYTANSQDQSGPLIFGIALERVLPNGKKQRIAVIGDGDFLSNTYLGNVGNQNLGFRIINWLNHNEQIIEVPTKTTRDREIVLSRIQVVIMGFGFLIILPLFLMAAGLLIWRKRKQK